MNEPRPYRDETDLEAMRSLLVAGRMADNGSYYIHTGDLSWWMYYPPLEGELWDHIHLWDDPAQPGRLLGWVLISPDWVGSDVYVQPELRESPLAREMYLWAEEEVVRVARRREKKTVYTLWILHDDEVLNEHYIQCGYHRSLGCVQLSRTLEDPIQPSSLVDNFLVRACQGLPEVVARAHAQHGAFESTATFELYLERFTRFMRSPAYQSELDIVAAAPDGQVGAFCIVWPDSINRVGLFEPVGTHPDFRRKGLGKAVMLEGLRRLQERGMKSAIVSTREDNLPAIKLYESIGFQVTDKLGTFEKDV